MTKHYLIPCEITGHATAVVTADSPEEALRKAQKGDWDDVIQAEWDANCSDATLSDVEEDD